MAICKPSGECGCFRKQDRKDMAFVAYTDGVRSQPVASSTQHRDYLTTPALAALQGYSTKLKRGVLRARNLDLVGLSCDVAK